MRSKASVYRAKETMLAWITVPLLLVVACGPISQISTSVSEASSVSTGAVVGDVPIEKNANLGLGMPNGPKEDVLISRHQYALAWNPGRHNLSWAAWRLRADDRGDTARQKSFSPDPDLVKYLASTGLGHAVGADDYRGSCFDRGHQVPSADRTASVPDNRATFVMSNILPQSAYLNRKVWEPLEEYERSLVAGSDHEIFIWTGPIYASSPGFIGPKDDIAVPSANFKIIARRSKMVQRHDGSNADLVTAVIMPNLTSKGTDPFVDHDQACLDSRAIEEDPPKDPILSYDWRKFEVSLSEIEQSSGLDFSFLE